MILLAFTGVYLLVEVKLTVWDWNIFLGLLSAIFAAVAYVSIRAIKHKESPLTIIFYFTGISTIGSLFFLPFGFKWPDFGNWLALAGVGIGSFYGQLWMTIALRRAPASIVSPFSYLTPLLSFVYGFIFLNEKVSALSCLGGCLIIVAGSLISYIETRVKTPGLPPGTKE
jgi:drug/metabolite transporter (DMT)-like permease